MSPLIDLNRAQQLSSLASIPAAYLNSLIGAASSSVRKYCARDFTQSSYSEYHNGGIYIAEPFALRNTPVVSITRIATNPTVAIQIQNTDTQNNQRATIATDLGTAGAVNNVILFWVSSGVPTTVSLPTATYLTIQAMVSAINAENHGWQASVQSAVNISMANFPSADLKPLQGATTAIAGSPTYLSVWLEDVSPFGNSPYFDDFYAVDQYQGQDGWRLDQEAGLLYGRFPRGQQNIRIDYTAGYACVPQDVQEATAQLVKWLNETQGVNGAMQSMRLGDAAYTLRDAWPGTVKRLLTPYIDRSKGVFRS